MTSHQPDQYGQVHPDETPELVASKLKEFKSVFDGMPAKDRENASLAETKCPDLVKYEFKLLFLRCEVFNEKLAVKRYIKYWDKRVEIFGPDKAFQPMTLENLKEDSIALSLGLCRLTGTKDASGRNLIYLDPSRQDKTKYATASMMRAIWYVFHAALEDVDTQKRGIIMMAYPANAKLEQFNRELARQVTSSIKGCLPVRLSAFHVCHPPTFFRVIFPIIKLFLGERLRKRIRVHAGSKEHVVAELDKFGLGKDTLPSDVGGTVVLDHQGWLKQRESAGQ